MSYYIISSLVNLIVCSFISIAVFFRDTKNPLNRVFAFFSASAALWSLGYFFWQISFTEPDALYWTRVLMMPACFISASFLHFSLVLTGEIKNKKKLMTAIYVLFFVFFLSDFGPYIVDHVSPELSFPFWPKPGLLFNHFLFLWSLTAIYAVYVMYKKFKTSRGILHSQLKYIIIGSSITFIGGSTNYFLWYGIPILPIGMIFVTALVASSYAVTSYQLTDIRVIGRKLFIYFVTGTIEYITFFSAAWFLMYYFGDIFSFSAYFACIFGIFLFVYLFDVFQKKIELIADRYIFTSLYTYRETLLHLAEDLSHSTDLNVIANSIASTLNRLGIYKVAIIGVKKEDFSDMYVEKNIGFTISTSEEISKCTDIAKYLIDTSRPVIRDELLYISNPEKVEPVALTLEKYGIALCLPLFAEKRLIGMIVLGSKLSGDAYSPEDLELLSILSYQAGIAFENGRLYKEVQAFNATLSRKVEEQTKELQEKAVSLESALRVKSEFIYLMSHQLRGPIAVITGMSSMLKDGDLDSDTPEKKQEFIDGIYIKSRKLANILNDVIEVTAMETNKFQFSLTNIQKVTMESIVKEICEEEQKEAKEVGIDLIYVPPTEPTPLITTDPHYLKHAITNIVYNGIKYTRKGYVKVTVSKDGNNVVCTIEDTGIGIPAVDQKRLFEKFVRGKNALEAYTYGTGLGLFIAKNVIEAHPGGNITFVSEEHKGTTFKVSIPYTI